MPRILGNLLAAARRNKKPEEQAADSARLVGKANIVPILLVVASFLVLQQQDAEAHSGLSRHGGTSGGQVHHPNFNHRDGRPGDFHQGHFRHHGPHGTVILVPPFLGYFPSPAYFNPPVSIGQASPMLFIEQESDGTMLNFWYYCANPAGYYPNVQQCPPGWQVVQASSSY
jgi:hypothetical protein